MFTLLSHSPLCWFFNCFQLQVPICMRFHTNFSLLTGDRVRTTGANAECSRSPSSCMFRKMLRELTCFIISSGIEVNLTILQFPKDLLASPHPGWCNICFFAVIRGLPNLHAFYMPLDVREERALSWHCPSQYHWIQQVSSHGFVRLKFCYTISD